MREQFTSKVRWEREVFPRVRRFEFGLSFAAGGSSGPASIVDIHRGIVSYGKKFADLHLVRPQWELLAICPEHGFAKRTFQF